MKARIKLLGKIILFSLPLLVCQQGQTKKLELNHEKEIPVCAKAAFRLQNVFGTTSFYAPILIRPSPLNSQQKWVIQKNGIVLEVDPKGQKKVLLDLRDKTFDEAMEAGLLGFEIHPSFHEKPWVFLSYNHLPAGKKPLCF